MDVTLLNNSNIICINDFCYLKVKNHLPINNYAILIFINNYINVH